MAKLIIKEKNNWLFEIVSDKKTFNVTESIKKHIDNKKLLRITKKFNYRNLVNCGKYLDNNYYLRISKPNDKYWIPISIKKGSEFTLNLNESEKTIPIIDIVYFINTDISNCYLRLLKDQLKDFINSKILLNKNLKLHCIIICSSKVKKIKIKKLFDRLKINKLCETNLEFSNNTNKEYKGIEKVWEISKKNKQKNSYIIYLHGKGLSYLQNRFLYIRQPLEKFLFKIIVYKWKRNIKLLSSFESINKLGALSGVYGFIWFNFWIVKSSYIQKLEIPKKRNRAGYYEEWLGTYKISKYTKSLKKYTNLYNDKYCNTIEQSINILSNPKKFKYNIGSFCEVKKGGFILGLIKYKYHIWYKYFVILNRLNLNKGDKKRFIFY